MLRLKNFLRLLCMAVFLQVSSTGFAQVSLGLDLGVGLPFGSFGNQVNAGFGGQINLNYYLNPNFSFGIGAGYYTFGGNNSQVSFEDFEANVTPLVLQADYYFTQDDVIPFIGVQAGMYRLASRFQVNNTTQVIGENYLGFAPKIGVVANVIRDVSFVGNMKYHIINSDIESTSFLSIHLGFHYLFAK